MIKLEEWNAYVETLLAGPGKQRDPGTSDVSPPPATDARSLLSWATTHPDPRFKPVSDVKESDVAVADAALGD